MCSNCQAEKEFDDVQARLQRVVTELKNAKDPSTRRRLLVSMRELLAEADRLIVENQTEG